MLEKKLDADPQFVEARDRLLAISEQSYRPWLVMVSGQAGHWLHSGLEAEDWTSALGFREIWEAVSVRADTEGADQVEESMSLPVQASAPVVQVLFRICQSMNRIGGHLMERVSGAVFTRLRISGDLMHRCSLPGHSETPLGFPCPDFLWNIPLFPGYFPKFALGQGRSSDAIRHCVSYQSAG